ncbi:MAG TPA: hypothetical protein VGI74_27630 [Streptosporangiaceae bacterium]
MTVPTAKGERGSGGIPPRRGARTPGQPGSVARNGGARAPGGGPDDPGGHTPEFPGRPAGRAQASKPRQPGGPPPAPASRPPAPRNPLNAGQMRLDRLYLGWQHAVLHPDPGPPPRRPTPPEQEQLNPDWVAAQRREENLLDRPLKLAAGALLVLAGLLIAAWVAGWLNGLLAWLGVIACLVAGGFMAYGVWQGEQTLRARVDEEKQRLGKIRAEQENRLFAWQAEHARRFQDWQDRRASFDQQPQWYAVTVGENIDRLDLAGGTLSGWSAMFTLVGASRLAAGGEVTVVDVSEGAVAGDLAAIAGRLGIAPLVWVLPADLPRLDLGAGLPPSVLADVLSLVVSVSEDEGSGGDVAQDNAILERLLGVFGETATIAQATAALRALGQIGDPRDDIRGGLLSPGQFDQITGMFGRAADQVVVTRAWAMESRLRKLDTAATELTRLEPSRLRVVCTDRRAGVFGNKVLGTYVVTALTHMLRQSPPGRPWQHTLMLAGADKLRGDVLDRLCEACEASRTGLLLAYRSIPAHVKERLGRGNAAVAFMRLGNAEDARIASEQIGTEHRFVLSQLTDTVGTSVTDTIGDTYTSTVGTADSVSASASSSETSGRSQGSSQSYQSGWAPFGDKNPAKSRSRDRSISTGTSDSASITEGINVSTAWGVNTSRAIGANDSLARTTQRSREFLVEQHELQQLPPSAVIICAASRGGRRVLLADANPGILGLPTATLLTLDEAKNAPEAPAIGRPQPAGTAAAAVSWRSGEAQPPPNLGPPPERLDWRKRRS